jgi:hypothetical protein
MDGDLVVFSYQVDLGKDGTTWKLVMMWSTQQPAGIQVALGLAGENGSYVGV